MPVGTFEVEAKPNSPNKIIAGADTGYLQNSMEYSIDTLNRITGGIFIKKGTLTVTKSGKIYSFVTDLSGTEFNRQGLEVGEVNDIVWRLTTPDFPEFATDKSRPKSTLKAPLDFGATLKEAFVDQWYIGMSSLILNRVVLHEKGVLIKANGKDYSKNGSLDIEGEGRVVILQFVTAMDDKVPLGTFNVGGVLDPREAQQSAGSACAANLYLEDIDMLGLGSGCWYLDVDNTGKVVAVAGAMPNQGFVTSGRTDPDMLFGFDFFDKYGNKVSGAYTGVPIMPVLESSSNAINIPYFPTAGFSTRGALHRAY